MKPQKGGVLLEAMVALAIFGIAVIGLLGSVAVSATLSGNSRYRTEAAMMADELLGQMAIAPAEALENQYGKGSANFKSWRASSVAKLPNGNADIEFRDGARTNASGVVNSTHVTLTIRWRPPDYDDEAIEQYETQTYFYRILTP